MLVGDCMTPTVITVTRTTPVREALERMRKWHIRRLPVVEAGRVIGIVTVSDLTETRPSQTHPSSEGALSSWELPPALDAEVDKFMTPFPKAVAPDAPLEEAATLMRHRKIGGLPVVRDGVLVGIITESDIFDALIGLLGARLPSYRITVDTADSPAAVPEITATIHALGLRLYSLVTYPGSQGRLRAVVRLNRAMPLPSLASFLSEHGLQVIHAADTVRPSPDQVRALLYGTG